MDATTTDGVRGGPFLPRPRRAGDGDELAARYDRRVRFEEAARRLRSLPDALPPSPAELVPIVVDGTGPPRGRRDPPLEGAVLVLVYAGRDGEARVLLTARPKGGFRHAGEVSLPGGRVEPGDASLAAAALREAREEVGLDPDEVGLRVVGALGSVVVPVSGFRVSPVLALGQRPPTLTPDPREVAAIVAAPLDHFVPPAPVRIVEAERDGRHLRYGAYEVSGYLVWGATARILGQLGAILAGGA